MDAGEDGSSSPAGPLLGAAGVLFAVGALRELRRQLHRRQSRQSAESPLERGSRPLPPSSVYGKLPERTGEKATDKKATGERAVDRVGAALVHLAGNIRPRGGDGYPQPRVVRVSDGRIDVLLSQPDPSPPPPWRPEGFGLAWVLDADVPLPPTEEAPPLPALVTIGTTDSDILADLEAYGVIGTTESDILVDLEAYGVIALVGDKDTCRGMARAIAGELSTRAQGLAAVEVIGDPLDDATAPLDGVDRHESWDDLDTATIDTSARRLDTGGWPHTWAARASGRIYDGWPPTVWITERSQESRYLDTLDAIATRPGAGTVLVVVGHDPGRGLRIHLDDRGRFNIPDLNLRGDAHTPTPTAPIS